MNLEQVELNEILQKARRYNALAFFFMNKDRVPQLEPFITKVLEAAGASVNFTPATMQDFDKTIDLMADAIENLIVLLEAQEKQGEQNG